MVPVRHRIGALAAAVLLAGAGALLAPASPAAADVESFDSRLCASLGTNTPVDNWAFDRLDLDQVHRLATGRDISIAVIDTGVDITDNPVFAEASIATLNTAELPGTNQQADCQHGTTVTSLIVGEPPADQRSQTNFSGVAPDARVIAIRALQKSPPTAEKGSSAAPRPNEPEPFGPTVEAIREAIRRKVDIINLSQAGTFNQGLADAVADAIDQGIVVVAAAGNEGLTDTEIRYPAALPGVIVVGACTSADAPAAFSTGTKGLSVDLCAPGEGVLAANAAQGASWSDTHSGTSFAAPIVTGVVALMLERDPGLTPAEIKRRLRATADPGARTVPDPQLGYGVLNPMAALTQQLPTRSPSPGPTPTPSPAQDYRDRPAPDHRVRNLALISGGVALVGVGVAAVIAASLPAGRRRGWQAASERDRDRRRRSDDDADGPL